jgi:hypothetical protein
VPLAESFALQPGQPVSVRIVVPDADVPVEQSTYSGHVTFVDSAVQEISQQVKVWAEVDNADGLLKEGLPTVMRIPHIKTAAQTPERTNRTRTMTRKLSP